MRVRALILVLAIGSLLGVHDVCAEKVKTNQETKVRVKPGEQEKVLLKLKSGQTMTVLRKDGRWLKVRVQGRTGYVPRSTVDMPDDDEIVRNTRRRPFVDGRSTKRGFSGDQAPDDRVGNDATGADDDDNASGAKPSAKVAASTKASSNDDDDDDSASAKPKAKPSAKGSAAAKAKPSHNSDDSDDPDDDTPPAKAKAKPAARPATTKAAANARVSDDDDDDDSDAKPKATSGAKAKASASADDDDVTKVEDDDKSDKKRATAHVSAKVVAYNEHDKESGEAFTAKPAEVLYPGESKGKWTFVETDDGDAGWVLSSQLDLDDGGDSAGGPRRRTIDLDANLGVTFLQQAMNTVGTTLTGPTKYPDIYTIGTSAFSLGLGGQVLFPYGKSVLLGGDGAYAYSLSYPGIYVPPMNGATSGTNEGVTFHNLNLRAVAGIDFHKANGIALFGRLGYRYQAFLVNGNAPAFNAMQNPAKLPSEVTQGPTIGAAVAIPRLTPKIGLMFALDAVLFGASVKQTTDLDDGTKPSAKLYSINGKFVYRWKPTMDLEAAYLLGIGSYDFGMPDPASLRGHTGMDVQRTDIYNSVTIGIAKGF